MFSLKVSPGDTVYLDPPYTKRQYASYYHIPETIAYHDEPKVEALPAFARGNTWHRLSATRRRLSGRFVTA